MLETHSEPMHVMLTSLIKPTVQDRNLGSLVSFVRDITLLISSLVLQSYEECGLSLKDIILLNNIVISLIWKFGENYELGKI